MRTLLVLLCLLLPLAGCGPSESTRIKKELQGVALQYHTFIASNGAAPTSADALLNSSDPNGNLPGNKARAEAMKKALASGDYTVYWGYDVTADKNRNATTVLAYHNDTPEKGGIVAYADGVVASVTADEFKSAAKASDFQGEPVEQQ